MEQLQTVLTWLQQASANFIQRPNAGQCVTQHESVSQTTRHDLPTSRNDTNAHLAHTSVQSRATFFSPHNSAPNSAITTNTPLSMFHCLRQVYILSIPPPHRVFNSERVHPPLLLVVVFTT